MVNRRSFLHSTVATGFGATALFTQAKPAVHEYAVRFGPDLTNLGWGRHCFPGEEDPWRIIPHYKPLELPKEGKPSVCYKDKNINRMVDVVRVDYLVEGGIPYTKTNDPYFLTD